MADCTIVALLGEHDLTSASLLNEAVGDVMLDGHPLVIDLSQTAFMDGSILQTLIGAVRYAHHHTTGIGIVNPTGSYAECLLLRMGLVNPPWPIHQDRAAAVLAARNRT